MLSIKSASSSGTSAYCSSNGAKDGSEIKQEEEGEISLSLLQIVFSGLARPGLVVAKSENMIR